jgi:hypothetical protein
MWLMVASVILAAGCAVAAVLLSYESDDGTPPA